MIYFIVGSIAGFGVFLLLFLTGYTVSAAFFGPLLGSSIGLLVVFPKDFHFKQLKPSWREFLIGALMGIFILLTLSAVAQNFVNLLILSRLPVAILFGCIVFIAFLLEELFFRNVINFKKQSPKIPENQSLAVKYVRNSWNTIKWALIQTGFQALGMIVPFLIMVPMIGNNFGLMFFGALTALLFVLNLIGSIWFESTHSLIVNVLVFTILITALFVSLTPICAPLAIVY